MKPVFYSAPVLLPRAGKASDFETRTGMQLFNRRAMELWQAAALISASEPGLLSASDRESARRKGLAAGRRILSEVPNGRAKIAYFRALSAEGLFANPTAVPALADRVWLLEDQYGLADSYLRAVADAALQHRAECVLCPSPLRRDQLEAVFLPGCRAAFLSMNIMNKTGEIDGHRVHLDRIPDAERKQALKAILRENRKWVDALIQRAAEQLRNAEILRDLKDDTCADIHPSL